MMRQSVMKIGKGVFVLVVVDILVLQIFAHTVVLGYINVLI